MDVNIDADHNDLATIRDEKDKEMFCNILLRRKYRLHNALFSSTLATLYLAEWLSFPSNGHIIASVLDSRKEFCVTEGLSEPDNLRRRVRNQPQGLINPAAIEAQ
ncbi:hypothetical protein Baya_13315 [Bagarius yarrelli]|uniref:Uncharacterized protein n=1 Tax=Bagarius yarrelli TaxID=175774 RepID=A0A556V5P6_BAGYA|nr:hypothetical protein Baya_13315 [Bagarius yarrelli]